MAQAPRLWYQVVFQEGVGNKLSYTPPYNECTITINSNVHIKKFYARATLASAEWGYDKGTLVAEYNNRDAGVNISFTLNANNHLIEGDGEYRIGLYLQDDNDLWNLDELFIVTSYGGSKFITDERSTKYYVGMSAPLYTMPITINAGTTIDLSLLKGISDTKIVWGDGTTTHKGATHTYTTAGTYTIQANFQDVINIDNYFLQNNTAITNIDFTNLKNVIRIGNNVMSGCTNLTSITTTNFSKIVNIGDEFLRGCSSLTTFTLDHFTALTRVGSYFLSGTGITTLSTTRLAGCTIDNAFLANCTALTTLNLTNLSHLTAIPDNFLFNCSALTAVDFSSMTNLATIGKNFLGGCNTLTVVNLASNILVRTIDGNFLDNCNGVTTLYAPNVSRQQDIPNLASWGTLNALTKIVTGTMTSIYKYSNVWKEKSDIMSET